MDIRTVSGHSPPLYNFLSCRLLHLRPPSSRPNLKFSNRIRRFRPNEHLILRGHCVRGLFDSGMAELHAVRSICRIRATNKIGVLSSTELFEVKQEKVVLQKGLLLEFRKDTHKSLLAVSQRPDGKKNWMVYDQNGTVSSIKPQQVTYIVPGIEDFDHTDIPEFIHKAQDLLDPTILECAWGELLEKSKLVTTEELAEIIYGSREPLESYCAHLLLSKDDIYFNEVVCKGSSTTYEPRPIVQILKAIGLSKTSSATLKLLIDVGYFPRHVNLDLLKLKIPIDHSDEVILAAEKLLTLSSDPDEINRKDLTFLKVYAIDVDEADELDDALSAVRLEDGRLRVWIHVADPTHFVKPHSIVDREALRRGTSIFLPTVTLPMFPEKLAMEGMSLQQGKVCKAVSVSVTLHPDGRVHH